MVANIPDNGLQVALGTASPIPRVLCFLGMLAEEFPPSPAERGLPPPARHALAERYSRRGSGDFLSLLSRRNGVGVQVPTQ